MTDVTRRSPPPCHLTPLPQLPWHQSELRLFRMHVELMPAPKSYSPFAGAEVPWREGGLVTYVFSVAATSHRYYHVNTACL